MFKFEEKFGTFQCTIFCEIHCCRYFGEKSRKFLQQLNIVHSREKHLHIFHSRKKQLNILLSTSREKQPNIVWRKFRGDILGPGGRVSHQASSSQFEMAPTLFIIDFNEQIHFLNWKNTSWNLDKYILKFGQIHF